jgi:predicted nucleic acid-binding Zn ribbon protein
VSDNDNFAQEFYWRMREAVTGRLSRDAKRIIAKKKRGGSRPFEPGRDPQTAGASLDALIQDFKWSTELGEAELFVSWKEVAGEDIAAKTNPETFRDGVFEVRATSTAWATQLRLLNEVILEKLRAKFPNLEITELKVLNPSGPNHKRGRLSVPGQGPRDTYN